MGIKKYRPITPTLRYKTGFTFDEITSTKPEKSLLAPRYQKAGRNNQGRITCRHRGGGHKRHYRIIDFKRNKFGVPGKVATIEYDPYRNCRICLISYVDGDKRYILQPSGLKVGDIVEVSGYPFVTGKGELSLHVDSIKMLTKAISPLPEKYHGITDKESEILFFT